MGSRNFNFNFNNYHNDRNTINFRNHNSNRNITIDINANEGPGTNIVFNFNFPEAHDNSQPARPSSPQTTPIIPVTPTRPSSPGVPANPPPSPAAPLLYLPRQLFDLPLTPQDLTDALAFEDRRDESGVLPVYYLPSDLGMFLSSGLCTFLDMTVTHLDAVGPADFEANPLLLRVGSRFTFRKVLLSSDVLIDDGEYVLPHGVTLSVTAMGDGTTVMRTRYDLPPGPTSA